MDEYFKVGGIPEYLKTELLYVTSFIYYKPVVRHQLQPLCQSPNQKDIVT